MKTNSIPKKLFVIVALGSFCMPAQAMQSVWDLSKKFSQNHPYVTTLGLLGVVGVGYWKYWTYKDVTIGQYVVDYTNNVGEQPDSESLSACVEYTNNLIHSLEDIFQSKDFDIDALDRFGATALNRACHSYYDRQNQLVTWLLKKGASIKKACSDFQLPPQSTLHNMFNNMHSWHRFDPTLIMCMQDYDDVRFFAKGLRSCSLPTWESIFGLRFHAYRPWVAQKEACALSQERAMELIHSGCRYEIDNIPLIISLAPPETDWAKVLDKPLLYLLCTHDSAMLQKHMPLIVRSETLKNVFIVHCEKFDCREYQAEFKKMVSDERAKHIMCGMLANKKLIDAQWRCV